MKIVRNTLFLLVIGTCAACMHRTNHSPRPSISDEAKAHLNKPVNCATAKQDIADLEEDRASTAKQVISGVRSVVPFAAAAGAVMGDTEDRAKVATGEYNSDIDAKIDQIRMTCGISAS